MQWIVAGNLTAAVADALQRHGHTVHTPAELDASPADPAAFFKAITQKQWDLLTDNPALVEYPYAANLYFPHTVVYLSLEGGDVEQDDAIDRLFDRYKRLSPRRLYTVTAGRVKIRQLPGAAL